MTWKSLENAGHILENNRLPQEPGMREAAAFLQQMVETFAQLSVDFYNIIEELPFTYKERQVQSVLLPAIAKISKAVWVELPLRRGTGSNQISGRVDYWVYYESFVFFIEAKHAWTSAVSQMVRQATQDSWKTASKAEARDYLAIDPDKLLKTALLVTPCYQSSVYSDKLKQFGTNQVAGIHQVLTESLLPKPNWSCMWVLPEDIQADPFEYDDGYEIYCCQRLNSVPNSPIEKYTTLCKSN